MSSMEEAMVGQAVLGVIWRLEISVLLLAEQLVQFGSSSPFFVSYHGHPSPASESGPCQL